jgi:hypothetical protein
MYSIIHIVDFLSTPIGVLKLRKLLRKFKGLVVKKVTY